MTSEVLMNTAQTERFESACTAAGARFVGGLFACLALVEHEFTGALTYYGLTPRDSRTATDNFMTQGWFTGLIPITVPIARGLLRRGRMGRAGFFRLRPGHGEGAVLPRIGVGAVVEAGHGRTFRCRTSCTVALLRSTPSSQQPIWALRTISESILTAGIHIN